MRLVPGKLYRVIRAAPFCEENFRSADAVKTTYSQEGSIIMFLERSVIHNEYVFLVGIQKMVSSSKLDAYPQIYLEEAEL